MKRSLQLGALLFLSFIIDVCAQPVAPQPCGPGGRKWNIMLLFNFPIETRGLIHENDEKAALAFTPFKSI